MPELCFAQVGQEQARLDSEDFAAGQPPRQAPLPTAALQRRLRYIDHRLVPSQQRSNLLEYQTSPSPG